MRSLQSVPRIRRTVWDGASGDSINHFLNGAPPALEGFGSRVVEKGETPVGKPYQPAIDFQSAYRKAWGITN